MHLFEIKWLSSYQEPHVYNRETVAVQRNARLRTFKNIRPSRALQEGRWPDDVRGGGRTLELRRIVATVAFTVSHSVLQCLTVSCAVYTGIVFWSFCVYYLVSRDKLKVGSVRR